MLSVGLAYDCEKTTSKRPRETTTYLDAFPGAEPVGSEEEDEDEVELFGENLEKLEKQRDANFIDDENDDPSNYEYDEEDIDDEDDDESSSSRQMDIVDDDDEIVDLSSSSSPETRRKKNKGSRYEPLQMTQEPTRKQPMRQARENAQPTLRRMFNRDIEVLVDSLGQNNIKTRKNFADIEKALSSGVEIGEWDTYDVAVAHKCDFCVRKAKCGSRITIGRDIYYCGTSCIKSVRPTIDLLIHVHTAKHTRRAEEKARDLVSEAQQGVTDKAREWKRRRGEAPDEEDAEDDNGIDISKKNKRRQRD